MNRCITLKEKFDIKELNLLKEQQNQKADLHIGRLRELRNHRSLTNEMLQNILEQKFKLCKEHMEQWKQLCMDHVADAMKLYEQNKQELAEFDKIKPEVTEVTLATEPGEIIYYNVD